MTVDIKKYNIMKKLIMIIIFAVGLGMNLRAQNDGFFSHEKYSEYRGDEQDIWGQDIPVLPGQHGVNYDFAAESAPVGSGLLLLGGLALAYGIRRKN